MNYNRRRNGRNKVKRILRAWPGHFYIDIERRMFNTRVPCSCPMCGNPRRHFGERTVQERREDERMAFELQEVGA